MTSITIRTKSGTVTATRSDEGSLHWNAVYPWGTQPLYGQPVDVEAFIKRRIVDRDEAI